MRARRARTAPRIAIPSESARIPTPHRGTSVAITPCGMPLMDRAGLRPSPAVRASVSDDGLVLLDVDGGLVLSANAVGARIWQLIEHGRSTGEIARQLADDYAVPLERAQRDAA